MVPVNDENHGMASNKNKQGCSGYCTCCMEIHALPSSAARQKGRELIEILEEKKAITLFTDSSEDSRFSTAPLFGEQRGKMFGVLKCLDRHGDTSWLYAFSGQFNGLWFVEGWAPPLFDLQIFQALHDPVERQIKELGAKMKRFPADSDQHQLLSNQRRQLSQQLMIKLHDLYQLQNFAGETATLHQAFTLPGGKPTGAGDCCAPKLLRLAAASDLLPLSLAEFYFGRSNRSGTKKHGQFYPPCIEKCQPLLGFLLCGIEQRKQDFVNRPEHPA